MFPLLLVSSATVKAPREAPPPEGYGHLVFWRSTLASHFLVFHIFPQRVSHFFNVCHICPQSVHIFSTCVTCFLNVCHVFSSRITSSAGVLNSPLHSLELFTCSHKSRSRWHFLLDDYSVFTSRTALLGIASPTALLGIRLTHTSARFCFTHSSALFSLHVKLCFVFASPTALLGIRFTHSSAQYLPHEQLCGLTGFPVCTPSVSVLENEPEKLLLVATYCNPSYWQHHPAYRCILSYVTAKLS